MKFRYILLSILVLPVLSCSDAPKKYAYTEMAIAIPKTKALAAREMWEEDDPHRGLNLKPQMRSMAGKGTKANFSWQVPKGWTEEVGSGLRLATLRKDDVEISIVTLSGMAGGVKSNLIRWMRQIGIEVPEEEFKAFVKQQEKFKLGDRVDALIVNFTSLQKKKTSSDSSMAATIVNTPTDTIFLKMMGPIQGIQKNFKDFKTFSKSLKF